jgi:two-component system phosphate regulon response regulator PhoB
MLLLYEKPLISVRSNMINKSILVVEDEKDILELVKLNLSQEGYHILCAETGEKALSILKKNIPDLIVLDLTLPSMNGLEMASRLKADPRTRAIPIVMIAGKMCDADVIAGLEMGADEYITKPFSPMVLSALARSVLRKPAKGVKYEEPATIRAHDMIIYPLSLEVLLNGRHIKLTLKEFGLLSFLAGKPGWVFTRSEILDSLKRNGRVVKDRAVDALIVGLRRKLGSAGKYVETVRSVGYRFRD